MSYTDWNDSVSVVATHQWVAVDNMLDLKNELAAVKFALQTERNKGLDILSKLIIAKKIVGRAHRFPGDDEVYIDLQSGDWEDKLVQIRNALNYKPPENAFIGGNRSDEKHSVSITRANDRGKSKEDMGEDATQIADLSERQKFEKLSVAYQTGIAAIGNQIGRAAGLYTQESFERRYNLHWKA